MYRSAFIMAKLEELYFLTTDMVNVIQCLLHVAPSLNDNFIGLVMLLPLRMDH
jgi:hypothetical protein